MSMLPEEYDDKELVQRFNNGETEVINILIDKYSSKAYQIAYGVLGNKEDAEEVAQDVFVRIYKALPKFRGDAAFTTWMYKIAVNVARNKYRWNKTRGKQKSFSIDAPVEGKDGQMNGLDLPDSNIGTDEQLELKELEANYKKALDKLKPHHREALILRNIEEMSYEEMAELLDCEVGTVKSRISRARESLRKLLKL